MDINELLANPDFVEPVWKRAQAAPADTVPAWPGTQPLTFNPRQQGPGPARGPSEPDDPDEEEPGDLDDQELRGPEGPKPGGFRPF